MTKRSTALKYTGFFKELPETLRGYFEKCEYQERKAALTVLTKMIAHTDIETAQSAFEITINMGLRDLDSIWTT